MKWITLHGVHFNTDKMTGFMWRDGSLLIESVGGKISRIPDPDRENYDTLCKATGVVPVTEKTEG